jgi:hypothetical protein
MGPLDLVWHLGNLFLPALGVACLAAAFAKLLWRKELAKVRWVRLALAGTAVGMLCLLAGVIFLGRDGRMLTYAALVAGCAAAQWWVGFGPGRR